MLLLLCHGARILVIGMLLALALISSSWSAALAAPPEPGSCKGFSCRAIQKYRAERAREWSFAVGATQNTSCTDCAQAPAKSSANSVENLVNIGSFVAANTERAEIIRHALKSAQEVQGANSLDGEWLEKWLGRAQITSVTTTEIAALFSVRGHARKKALRILARRHEGRAIPFEFLSTFTNAFMAFCSYPEARKDDFLNRRHLGCRPLPAWKKEDGGGLLSVLLARARGRADAIGVGVRAEKDTPFLAKFVLAELIDSRLKTPSERLEFWKGMKLKTNYFEYNYHKKPLYREFVPGFGVSLAGADPGFMAAHGGYEFGASRKAANPLSGSGFDCSQFVQNAYTRDKPELLAKYKNRFATVIMHKQLTGAVSEEPFACEALLVPGSIVVGDGHTFIFLGYAKDPRDVARLGLKRAPLRMLTVEAEGHATRSVGIFYRKMLYELMGSGCDLSKRLKILKPRRS